MPNSAPDHPDQLSQDAMLSLSGQQVLQAMIDGRIPPPAMALTLGFALRGVSRGGAEFVGQPGERHYNPLGTVHGGFATTLLDSCMGCAVHSMLDAGIGYTTMELKVNLIRPISADTGEVRAVGTTIHVGRRSGIAEGRLLDADDKLLAFGTTTCLIFPVRA